MTYRLANPYTLALVVVALLSIVLAGAVVRHQSRRMGRALAAFLVGEGVWALGDALRIAAPSDGAVLLWNDVAYLGTAIILPGYVLFFAAYSGREWWFRRRYVAALLAVSGTMYALVLTNHWHHLWLASVELSPGSAPPVLEETWGPVWYGWAVYAYALVFLGAYYAADEFLTAYRSGTHAVRAGLVLVGILVPISGNILFLSGVVPFDPMMFLFGFTGLAFSVAILRYRLLGVGTIARAVVVGNLDAGVVVLDAEDAVVDANERALALLETEREALLGRDLWALLADVEGSFDWLREARDDRGTVTVETGDGPRHFDVEVSPIEDALGTPLGRALVFTDVTDRVRRREQLRARTDELRRQNERLERFAEVVGHDLRNPLHVAQGYLDVADVAGDDADLDRVEEALDRMEAIVDDLLALARAGDTIDETDRGPVAVGSLARDAWNSVDADGATLTVADDLPTVEGDRDRLLHVAENLFRNAAEHNEAPVTVTVGPLDDGAGFYVADDGDGVPADLREQVFEHGFTTSDDGTGFGLSIVADVVDAHGWSVALAEDQPDGARFEVRTG